MRKAVAAVLATSIAVVGLTSCSTVNPREVSCTVTGKDRSTGSDGKSVFRVYTEDCGDEYATMGFSDNIFKGNFNASDQYGRLKVGKTYNFEVSGVRNGLFSLFPEITRYTEAAPLTSH